MTTAALSVIYAVSGYLSGHIDFSTAVFLVSGSGFGAGLGRKIDRNTAAVERATLTDIHLARTAGQKLDEIAAK